MTLAFWGAAIAMGAAASTFLIKPLARAKGTNWALVASVAILVPAFAIGVYFLIGSPSALTGNPNVAHVASNGSARTPNGNGARIPGSVASLIGGLRSRLEQDPDDAGGWLLLAQSYRHVGDTAAAGAAYQRAKALGKTDARFESGEISGLAAQTVATADVGARVSGQVSLAPELADQIRPDDTVFIFAKESKAHRMPIAAIRRPAAALPIDFELTNSQAMIAGTDLANYESLIVTARVSRSGLATDSETGWEAWSAPISPLDGDIVELVIAASETAKVNANE